EAKTESRQQEEQAIPIKSIEIATLENQVKDLGEVIDRLSGVRVRATGSFGDPADVSINGLGGTAVRTYLNGLPLEFLYPGLDLTNIPLNNISRVDVYKGVVPISVGTDAMGGGINVVTAQKDFNQFKTFYSYGSFNTHQVGANLNLKLKDDLFLNLNTTYNYSDNDYRVKAYVWEEREEREVRRFHDAYRLFFADASLEAVNKPWADRIKFNINYANSYKELQQRGLLERTAIGDTHYEGESIVAALDYEKKLGNKLSLKSAFSYAYSNIIYADTASALYSWSGEVLQRRDGGEYGGGSTFTDRDFHNYLNRTTLVFQPTAKDEIVLSNLFAYQTTTGRDLEKQNAEEDFLTRPQDLLKNILGLEYNRKLLRDRLTLSGAVKLYFYDLQGVESRSLVDLAKDDHEFGGYISGKYEFSKKFFVRASYERTLRIPLFNQFFGDGGVIFANLDLEPERSNNYNLGFNYQNSSSSDFGYGIELNGFLRNQSQLIYLTPNEIQRYENAEDVRTIGLEGSLFVDFLEHWRFKGNLTRLSKTYQSVEAGNVGAEFLVGTDFPNTPSLFSNLQLEYTHRNFAKGGDRFYVYLRYAFINEFNFLNQSAVYNPDNYVPVQNRIDTGIAYSVMNEKLTVAVNVNNLLDAEVFDNFSIPRPGRNANIRLTYQISDF
ncbi:MAG: TonB-dependent receptor, partial [Bacteroidota bacterium]